MTLWAKLPVKPLACPLLLNTPLFNKHTHMDRLEIQDEILAAGSAPQMMAGLQVRPVTFASLLVLRKLGNPLAAALETGSSVFMDDLEAIAEFLWVQCAPWDSVRRLTATYRKGEDRSLLDATILDFAATLTTEQIVDAMDAVTRHGEQVAAVAAEVLPDADNKPSKN